MHPGFCYLDTIDDSILQDIRYASSNNFVGRPIAGYRGRRCIVSRTVGNALAQVQQAARQEHHLTLKVFDAYRPQKAVDDFALWAQDPAQQERKAQYYPRLDKALLFDLGFIARKSQHSRGCAVDVTLAPLDAPTATMDMGTEFDVFDEMSHTAHPHISAAARHHRSLLVGLMERFGFQNYSKEWWHFSLQPEPFPDTYFDFDVA